jgi:hypothetical protein
VSTSSSVNFVTRLEGKKQNATREALDSLSSQTINITATRIAIEGLTARRDMRIPVL